jgi:hypothetical protein
MRTHKRLARASLSKRSGTVRGKPPELDSPSLVAKMSGKVKFQQCPISPLGWKGGIHRPAGIDHKEVARSKKPPDLMEA